MIYVKNLPQNGHFKGAPREPMVGHDEKPNTSFTSEAQTRVTSKNASQIYRSVLELQRVHDSGESEKVRS
jgi:hypothetical protein